MKLVPIYLLIMHITSGITLRKREVCPNFCDCDMWYGLRRAVCSSQRLYSIQTGVPNIVQALDLSSNSISRLDDYEFRETGLLRLKYLNLSSNAIGEIGLHAFAGLVELTVLDLSRNHLYYLLEDTFIDSSSLRILRLDENRFNTDVPNLRSQSLTEITLSSCQISYVPQHTFEGLTNLRHLDLSNNLMIQLDSRVLKSLLLLRNITFEGNPWSCNKDMHDLQAYLKRRNVNFVPACKDATLPIKFEKIISLIPTNPKNSDRTKSDVGTTWVTDKPLVVKEISNITVVPKKSLVDVLSTIHPAWIFIIGFALGTVSSMIGTYIWLTGMLSCSLSNCQSTRRADNASQRVSLLQYFSNTPVCPGTPPPPYRDFMLHKYLQPSAPNATLLFNESRNNNQ